MLRVATCFARASIGGLTLASMWSTGMQPDAIIDDSKGSPSPRELNVDESMMEETAIKLH